MVDVVRMRIRSRWMLPSIDCWRVSANIAGWCAFFNSFFHRTKLLGFFFMLMSMLRLLRNCKMVLMVFGDTALAPILSLVFNQCTGVIYFCYRKYRPLVLPQNIDIVSKRIIFEMMSYQVIFLFFVKLSRVL